MAKVKAAGATTTFHLSKDQSIEQALERMPMHRSMRVDGPSWRGRPLGHGFDPLRSALAPMARELFIDVVTSLLDAHDFRALGDNGELRSVRGLLTVDRPTVLVGRLYLTYEWVLPLFTEFGYDESSDFRVEGDIFHAQGDVILTVDPTGVATPEPLQTDIAAAAKERDIRRVLVMSNSTMNPSRFGSWFRGLTPDGLTCEPQFIDSLTFNVLTTTNVFLEFHEHLNFEYVNYL